MKMYALMKPVPGSDRHQADMTALYTQEEAARLINEAYWSLELPPPVVPLFLAVEMNREVVPPSLQSYLLSVGDE